jgi:hypothetical protein
MNPRATLVTLLGWCPGVQAAANFLPDREVSNKQIALSITLLVIVTASTFTVSEALLANYNFTNTNIKTTYTYPVIQAIDGNIYLTFIQQSSSTGFYNPLVEPPVKEINLYFAELIGNGTLRETLTVAKVDSVGGGIHDLLVSQNGTRYLTYSLISIDSDDSTLNLVMSSDGKNWGAPIEVYHGYILSYQPSLLVAGDKLFLEFEIFNQTSHTWSWLYSIRDDRVWSTPRAAPFSYGGESAQFRHESAYLDRDGNIGVVWDSFDQYEEHDLGIMYSLLVNGSWSEPQQLTSGPIPLRGQNPRILYSAKRGGYYLTTTDLRDGGSHVATSLYFSSDWVSWRQLSYLPDVYDYSLAELRPEGDLPDLSLGIVYVDYTEGNPAGSRLYLIQSGDGVSWSDPQLIEAVENDSVLSEAVEVQRTSASLVIGLVAMIGCSILLVWHAR